MMNDVFIWTYVGYLKLIISSTIIVDPCYLNKLVRLNYLYSLVQRRLCNFKGIRFLNVDTKYLQRFTISVVFVKQVKNCRIRPSEYRVIIIDHDVNAQERILMLTVLRLGSS